MSVKVLYKVGAFGPGSSLWIIPFLNHSSWSQRINWHLNFQISKMRFLKFKSLSKELKKTLKENNLPFVKTRASSSPSPLLIASHRFLPNSKIVELPETKTNMEWIRMSYKIWKDFDFPSLRLFLTKDFPISEFQNLWPERDKKVLEKSGSITLVPDDI